MNTKGEVTDRIIEWHNKATTQTGKKLREFHTDGGTEYISSKLQQFFKDHGVHVTTTTKGTPQHNGIAERANRTIWEMALSMLLYAGLPGYFWEYAVLTAVYIRNRCLTTGHKTKTPEELWSGNKPYIKHLRIFGCDAYLHVQSTDRSKLEPKAKKCIFVGYSTEQQGWKLYDVNTRKIHVSRDVKFDETSFTLANMLSQQTPGKVEWDMPQYDDTNIYLNKPNASINTSNNLQTSSNTYEHFDTYFEQQVLPVLQKEEKDNKKGLSAQGHEEKYEPQKERKQEQSSHGDLTARQIKQIEARIAKHDALSTSSSRPQREIKTIQRLGNMVNYEDMIMLVEDGPSTYNEAMQCDEHEKWKQAMDDEITSLEQNNTWELCELPEDKHVIGGKWVLKKKLNKEGKVERYKARYVAKGFSQKEGIDYNETFAPVVKYKSLRIILSLAASNNWEIKQMDVKTAFLYATINEEVYMKQPEGYEKGNRNLVCRLKKTIYGTKQAPNRWNETFTNHLKSIGFIQCVLDPCVFYKQTEHGMIIMTIFVDDILATFPEECAYEWEICKQQLMAKFKMQDLGNCEWILGMRITRDRKKRKLCLDQTTYTEKVLKHFNMEICKTTSTPESGRKLSKEDCPSEEHRNEEMIKHYQSMVGALMYLSLSTRPDIAHAVNRLSRFLTNPGRNHINAAKHALRYLRENTELGLCYENKHNQGQVNLSVYCDADWANDKDERKSTSGYIIFLNNCPIIWNSKKQKTVALSSAEAEYMAISGAAQEVLWCLRLLKELHVDIKLPIQLYCDNMSAISISQHDGNHQRTKHIDIRHHFVRELVKNGTLQINWTPTKTQMADILTKSVSSSVFKIHVGKIMSTKLNGPVIPVTNSM